MKMVARTIIVCSLLLGACSQPPPLSLITMEEASKPASRGSITIQRNGPNIEIIQPNTLGTLASPFPIHIEFSIGSNAAAVNMSSLKLTYMKLWGIDITDRVKEYISGTTISVPEATMPAGKHTIEIYIEDNENNISTQQIVINVISGH